MTSPSTYSDEDLFDSINTTQAELDSLPEKEPPNAELCYVHGEKVPANEVWVITYPEALQQVREHAESNLNSELGGALLGKAYRYKGVIFVDVMAAIPVASSDHGPIHFTFSADAWPQIQKERNEHYPELDIVGWFHTHPDLGVFYSSDDVVVHSAAFTLPWHVGLVVDPVRNEACFFGWVNGRLAPFAGFFERLSEGQETSVIPWRVIKTRVWDVSYDYDSYQSESNGAYANPDTYHHTVSPSEFDMIRSWAGLGFGLFGLFLALILYIGGIRPLQTEVESLESAVVYLANESFVSTEQCPQESMRILYPPSGYQISKGSELVLLGTAVVPESYRYQIAISPLNQPTTPDERAWDIVYETRQGTNFGEVGTLYTGDWPGNAYYSVRLQAVDRERQPIASAPTCTINIYIEQKVSLEGPSAEEGLGTDNE